MRQILIRSPDSVETISLDGSSKRGDLAALMAADNKELVRLMFNGVECNERLDYYIPSDEPFVAIVERVIKITSGGLILGLFRGGDTVAKLKTVASDLFKIPYARTILYFNGARFDPTEKIGKICTELSADISVRNEDPPPGQKSFCVSLHSLTGKIIHIEAFADEYVADFKSRVTAVNGTPQNQMRLIFSGKQLEDERLMNEYGICAESRIHLVHRLRGGGSGRCMFPDVSDENTAVVCQWSAEAPRWRMAEPGLCIEGICTNSDCKAFNKQVIWNARFGAVDIGTSQFKCPMCYKSVETATCAFNNCAYRICGKKTDGSEEISTNFQVVRDEYKRFDESHGKIGWDHLMIMTRHIFEQTKVANGKVCAICLNPVNDGVSTPCEHVFHRECIGAWVEINPSCPNCRAALGQLDDEKAKKHRKARFDAIRAIMLFMDPNRTAGIIDALDLNDLADEATIAAADEIDGFKNNPDDTA